jgi:hypothetical protein
MRETEFQDCEKANQRSSHRAGIRSKHKTVAPSGDDNFWGREFARSIESRNARTNVRCCAAEKQPIKSKTILLAFLTEESDCD